MIEELYVECAPMVKSAATGSWTINSGARQECEDIMERIRSETPSFWPYGCSIGGHLACNGEVYMIRKASTKEAVGFTGWQEIKQGGEKVGYYSIGILPEYRGHGFAKTAVARLLRLKSAGVDRVQAFIARDNVKSLGLAKALGIPVVHDA